MKTTSKIFLLFIAASLLVASCKKNKTTPEEEPEQTQPVFDNSNAQAIFANLETPVQSYTLNTSTFKAFTCANGTQIFIYPNAFLTQSGGAVTGIVNIEVKDILSKKDMILNNAVPVSNGQLLVSGGEVYFNATQNNQKLKINPTGGAVRFNIPVPISVTPSTQMLEFYSPGPASLTNTDLNWATNTNTVAVNTGTVSTYYSLNIDSVTWTNCDYFANFPGAKTTCTVNTTGISDNTNTAVFLSMNGNNILARLGGYQNQTQQFQSYANSIPVGQVYTIVAVTYDGTNYYYGSQQVTMVANMVINMPALTQSTSSQIINYLNNLP